jgi:hypothetical protein
MTLDAKKNGSKYEISASIGNLMTLEWTISAKLSKWIDYKKSNRKKYSRN